MRGLKDLTVIEEEGLRDLKTTGEGGLLLQTGKPKNPNVISQKPNASLHQIKRLQRNLFMTKVS